MKSYLSSLLCAVLLILGSSVGFLACSDDDGAPEILPPTDETPADSTSTPGADSTAVAVLDSAEVWCNRDGQRIYGMLYKKVAPDHRAPAVILSHSAMLTHAAMKGYAKALAEKGLVAYCFDFCGGSADSRSDGSTDSMTVFTEVDDLKAVLSQIRKFDCVDADSVYLLGSSQGGLVSALAAEDCADRVRGLILFYPAFNMPDLIRQFGDYLGGGSWGNMGGSWGGMGDLGNMFTFSQAFIDALKDFDVWSHIGTYPRPVVIIHGSKDIVVPVSNSEKAVKLYPDATLHIIEGASHGFNAANLGELGAMMGFTADYDDVVLPIVYQCVNR
ncbi:MAG: alpha/beta hydrolase family protein [Alloprevotella sp.]